MLDMNEQLFQKHAQQELLEIVRQLEEEIDREELDIDVTCQDGVVEIDFDRGGKIVLNQHLAMQEIWLASRLGAHHFACVPDGWFDTRSALSLRTVLDEALRVHSGGKLALRADR